MNSETDPQPQPIPPTALTSSWAILQSKGVVGVRSEARRGQFTRKKWFEPHRIRSPFLSGVRVTISAPLTQVRAPGRGMAASSLLGPISRMQCSAWIPKPKHTTSLRFRLTEPSVPNSKQNVKNPICVSRTARKTWVSYRYLANYKLPHRIVINFHNKLRIA